MIIVNKYWNLVWLGVIFEIGWVVGLKHADTALTWGLTIIAIYISMHALVVASSKLPTGTTYAVFTGMGTAGTVCVEMVVFGEPFQLIKVGLIALLLVGVIGLKVVTKPVDKEGEQS
ncbi:multidrug efflux SMR transporter [Ornithinibacillus sp. BX22]|uniref:Multidrug efflux SMR transporter n=2 Tax=Ornithinibacillus TaxID=484508 RepID=A0A923RLM5_9BACI|nr:multidrug efflux SMR transporter [Ornithinibacillus massiliensis]MBC5638257.1 multidrug efflux SMR transporter [Ornithinibacillus hominis]MBS3682114.1 multidrug efflux SMR transporter [Ornithinibacillus massiliensis]